MAEGLLDVYRSELRWDWVLTVVFNAIDLSAVDVVERIEARGFSTAPPTEVGRTGKPMLVPPRRS